MSDWKVVIPAGTQNVIENPSFETATTGWVTGGTNTIARDAAEQFLGVYSAKTTYQDNALLASYAITLTAAEYTFSVMLWIPTAYDGGGVSIQFANFAGISGGGPQAADLAKRDEWQLVEVAGTPVGGDLVGDLQVVNTGAAPTAGRFLYLDSAQCETGDVATTRCDGTQPGCEWLGAEHASISQRSAISRAGGLERDLREYLSFGVDTIQGFGMSGQDVNVDEYIIIPGGTLNSIKVRPRTEGRLTGFIRDFGDPATCNIHEMRRELTLALSPRSYPDSNGKPQPVQLRYNGAAQPKVLPVHLADGLECNITNEVKSTNAEPTTLHFISPQTFWQEIGNSAALLDTTDTITTRYITARLRSTGQWDDLGLTADPTTGGTVYALAVHPNGKVYVGGDFTGWNGVAGRDYIVSFDLASGNWETVGAASAVTGIVRAIAIASNGDIYIGGDFLNVGDANGDYLAFYDLSAGAWSSVAPGGTGTVQALEFGLDGVLYIGGVFTNWNGNGASDYIVKWNGSTYSPLSTGCNSVVTGIATHPDGTIYVCGDFSLAGGVSGTSRVAGWTGTSWFSLNGGVNATAQAIVVDEYGIVYLCGSFTTANGPSASIVNYIARWNGIIWSSMAGGLLAAAYAMDIAPDGTLYVSGAFATSVLQWNGVTFANLDVALPGSPIVNAIRAGRASPLNATNHDVFMGFSASIASATRAGSQIITNAGTTAVYPTITVKRTGGTGVVLRSIRNEITGKVLRFDYALLADETLTIIVDPTGTDGQSIISSVTGRTMRAILPNSDLGTFRLVPGSNQITAFHVGSTVEATIQWRETSEGLD